MIGGFILTILITFCILVLGSVITAKQAYPTYILGKKISIGDLLEQIEVIVSIVWVLTIYLIMEICFYGLALGLTQIFWWMKELLNSDFPIFH
ncbi:GerAB/ArcD/ProY family transporter [Niallia endozanthoxylica]|uniref:GerAB/ArcD/ProY family transporter n=1 Tax=Niallia endozanthoxylica TaxID=2036016 RepID=A0A5J5H669_9BACI|nr:GerAB/ArcD/ProY family transporter [Niallia endozanthoxylica]